MPGLFGSAPPPPQVAVAPAMPDAQSPTVLEAQNAAATLAQNRAGRKSDTLGKQATSPTVADSYSGSKLGAAA